MIKSKQAKYIKLGGKSAYEEKSFNDGLLLLGYHEIADEYCRNKESLIKECKNQPNLKNKAKDHARQIYDFYYELEDTIWITFANGYMYWCQAEKEVNIISYDDQGEGKFGSRYRKTINGWSSKDIYGKSLRISDLNGNFTKVMGYRGTICDINNENFNYLLRKINGQDLEEVAEARIHKQDILESIEKLMKFLHWRDFELLVELVFAQSGWQRLSSSGGTQKTIDIEMVLPSTAERAFVQVKSSTNQSQLNEYEELLNARDDKYMFYVYHTARGKLSAQNERTKLIGPKKLAEMILNSGLFNWLIERVG
jgi:hypothetical protein